MCFFFNYDELVRLSSYQTLGGGISEYFSNLLQAEQSCVIWAAHELSLGTNSYSWPWYSPTYAINSLTYEKY